MAAAAAAAVPQTGPARRRLGPLGRRYCRPSICIYLSLSLSIYIYIYYILYILYLLCILHIFLYTHIYVVILDHNIKALFQDVSRCFKHIQQVKLEFLERLDSRRMLTLWRRIARRRHRQGTIQLPR